jgi:hypothetical protein
MQPMLFAATGCTVVRSKSEERCGTARDREARAVAAAACTILDSRVHVSRPVVEHRAQDDALLGESSFQVLESTRSYVQSAPTPV